MTTETVTGLLIFGGLFVLLYLVSVFLSNARDARCYGEGQHFITIEYTNGVTGTNTARMRGRCRPGAALALGHRKVHSVKIVYANGAQEYTRYDRSEMREGEA